MTPSKAQTNAAAAAAQTALISAANAAFIVEADKVIATAVTQGKFRVLLHPSKYVNFADICSYYQNLGYIVGTDPCPTFTFGPAQLFGYFWDQYWNNTCMCWCPKPCRVFISWK